MELGNKSPNKKIMNNNSLTIYAVIVSFNGSKYILNCIDCLLNSNVPVRIVVIDNNSNDSTAKLVKDNFPDVKLIKLKKNIGFGRANNIGIKIAYDNNADYVFLLNQDAWIEPNSINSLIEISQSNHEFAILSPIHLAGNGIHIDYSFLTFLSTKADRKLISDLYLNRVFSKQVYQTQFVNAAVWLITRKCLEIVGGFDPIFYLYGEDDDYINRVLMHGLKIGICPEVIAYHGRDQNPSSEINFNRIYAGELLTAKIYGPNKYKLILKFFNYSINYILKRNMADKIGLIAIINILKNYKTVNAHYLLSKSPGLSFLIDSQVD